MTRETRRSLVDVSGDNTQGRLTKALAITAFFAALGNSFNHGFNTGVLNTPAPFIKIFLNDSFLAHYGIVLDSGVDNSGVDNSSVNGTNTDEGSDDLLDLFWAMTVSIYLVGGCAGAFAAGILADKFGRKRAIMLMAIPGLVANGLFAFCKIANSLEMLILGRLIMGFSCGAGSGLVPMYLTEISPVNIRGAMGILHQLALTCGILVAQLLGLRQILGGEDRWPYLLACSALPYILCCIVLPFYPDSPRWLLVKKGDRRHAVKALQTFRDKEDVSADLEEMDAEVREQQKEPAWSLMALFRSVPHRIPLMLVCVLAITQQLSGINMVFYYSDGVFETAGIPKDDTQYATLGLGAVNVLMTIISVFLVEKAGRRILLLGGMGLMVVALILMTIALYLQLTYSWFSYISIVCTVLFVMGFAIGLGSIPQFIGAEIFKQGPRPPAMSFAGFLNWVANFIVGISFPFLVKYMKSFCTLLFIVFLVVFGVVILKFLPETKNKTFNEIAIMLKIPVDDDYDENENDTAIPLKDIGNGHTDPESVNPLLKS